MSITLIIIGLTVLVSLAAFNNQALMGGLIMNPYQAHRQNQYYRFITSGFIHADWSHLIFNMFSLYFFGRAVEQIFALIFGAMGNIYFVALYIMAIVISDVPTFFKRRNNPRYNSLGASGGVAAVIFAFIIFLPLENICIYVALCMPGFVLGIAYVVYSYIQGKRAGDNINHDAHLYGALFGFIFCIVMYPPALPGFIEQIRNWDFLQRLF
jgi:membrane associated rhomboid family serine protease